MALTQDIFTRMTELTMIEQCFNNFNIQMLLKSIFRLISFFYYIILYLHSYTQ